MIISNSYRHYVCALLNLHKRYMCLAAGEVFVCSYKKIGATKISTNAKMHTYSSSHTDWLCSRFMKETQCFDHESMKKTSSYLYSPTLKNSTNMYYIVTKQEYNT